MIKDKIDSKDVSLIKEMSAHSFIHQRPSAVSGEPA